MYTACKIACLSQDVSHDWFQKHGKKKCIKCINVPFYIRVIMLIQSVASTE